MTDEKNLKQARATFQALCEMLKEENWHFDEDEENLSILCSAQGDDLPINLRIQVDADRLVVLVMSGIPFIVPDTRRTEMAVAVCAANFGMDAGCFDYNFTTGAIVFRATASFRESLISKKLLEYLVKRACIVTDHYNDKFLMVAMSDMGIEDILNYIE